MTITSSRRLNANRSPSNRAAHPRRRTIRLAIHALEDRLALTVLPVGFTEILVTTASDLSGPTAMEFSPTGQLWVLEQGGRAKLVRADGTTSTALTLTVDSAGERGLLGLAFDPTYDGAGPNTDFMYLYYTTPRTSPTDPSNNRVSRFTVTGAGTTTPTLGSELILRDLPPEDEDNNLATDGDTNHNGGAIHFGPDGKLYVAVGDHNYDISPQSQDVSQTLTTPFGKMLRLNKDGTNPTDNPFYAGNATDSQGAIWTLGLRNPYTFAFQAGTGKMFINDVGESTWEEIDQGQASANYGWAGSTSPLWEGFQAPPPAAQPPWTNYTNPVMAYDHSDSAPSPAGVAITGGAFYPSGSQFGAAYAGKYFFADYGASFIRVFDPAQPGTFSVPDTSTDFASNLTTGNPVDLKVDAAGSLYFLSNGGEIYKISATLTAQVVGRKLFYNDSKYDGNNPAVTTADDDAMATDKTAYLPGASPATFANISSYSRGINGIMIDLAGSHGTITAADFTFRVGNNNTPSGWAPAPAVTSVVTRRGAGTAGSDRFELTWADGAIQKQWLEVIVAANADTGLASADKFFFGSAVADSVSDTTAAGVDVGDELAARNNSKLLGQNIPVTNLFDYNRDGLVNITDQLLARNNQTLGLGTTQFILVGAAAAAPEVLPLAASPDDLGGAGAGLSAGLTSVPGSHSNSPIDRPISWWTVRVDALAAASRHANSEETRRYFATLGAAERTASRLAAEDEISLELDDELLAGLVA